MLALLQVQKHQGRHENMNAPIKLYLWDILLHAAPVTNAPACSKGMHTNNLQNRLLSRCIIPQRPVETGERRERLQGHILKTAGCITAQRTRRSPQRQ